MKISMRLFQHRGIFYVEINGKRRSLETRDKAEARRAFNQVKKEYLAGKLAHLTGKCQVTLGQYWKEFLEWSQKVEPNSTFRANRLALGKLILYAGETTTLDLVSRKHLDQMVADSKGKGLSANSINNYIRHARSSLNKAVEWGYVAANPLVGAKELPKPKQPPRFLDRHGVSRFLAGIGDVDLRRMIVAYLATGRRRTELLDLAWDDIDLETNRYFIRKAKNHLSRWYPINSMFKAVLLSLPRREGRAFDRFRHPDTISHYVKRALVASGYGDMRLHDLRHTFASLQVMQGRDLKTVQELLGHTELKTTQIYAHLSDDFLREASEINLGPVDLMGSKDQSERNRK